MLSCPKTATSAETHQAPFRPVLPLLYDTGDLRCHLGPKNATQKPMVVWGRYMLGQSKKPV